MLLALHSFTCPWGPSPLPYMWLCVLRDGPLQTVSTLPSRLGEEQVGVRAPISLWEVSACQLPLPQASLPLGSGDSPSPNHFWPGVVTVPVPSPSGAWTLQFLCKHPLL